MFSRRFVNIYIYEVPGLKIDTRHRIEPNPTCVFRNSKHFPVLKRLMPSTDYFTEQLIFRITDRNPCFRNGHALTDPDQERPVLVD